MRSGRIHERPTTRRRRRVLRLHKRMIHAPEDVMCYAVQGTKPLWKNTNVTIRDIRTVFKHSPCLICVLAKKRKEGMAQWKPRKKYKKLRIGTIGYERLEVINHYGDESAGRVRCQTVHARGTI